MTPAERKKTERWAKQVNKLARDLEDQSHAIHPSAWPEALGPDIERYRELAGEGGEQ